MGRLLVNTNGLSPPEFESSLTFSFIASFIASLPLYVLSKIPPLEDVNLVSLFRATFDTPFLASDISLYDGRPYYIHFRRKIMNK